MTETLSAPGELITRKELTVRRAREVAHLVASVTPPYTRLVECRHRDEVFEGDVLVLDVEVELPQRPLCDIQRRELIAVTFKSDDRTYPEVEALRADFPQVPHLNLRAPNTPRSLCLYEEPWEALKLHWSPGSYLERIREWLAQTARGELHAEDQALEPLFLSAYGTFVLSDAVLRDAVGDSPESIRIVERDGAPNRTVLVAEVPTDGDGGEEAPFVAVAVKVQPRTAGVIQHTPADLGALHEILALGGDDLAATLRSRLGRWIDNADLLEKHLILLLIVPKSRSDGGTEEEQEVWAFLTTTTVAQVGISIDLWEKTSDQFGRVLKPDPHQVGHSVELGMLNVVHGLSRERAAGLNGIDARSTSNNVAVGVGALGSQVCLNLARSGWGQWTYIDHDYVLPHNLARHALLGFWKGMPKAPTLAFVANGIIEGEPLATSIIANVLQPGPSAEQLRDSLSGADLILDMAASVPVARALARDFDSSARRLAIFLNPSGTDLVVLAEDAAREIPLDSLEMQYYRSLVELPDLSDHLSRPEQGIRYGQACRDVSFVISQELVALHASIGARLTRQIAEQSGASISIFRADPNSLTVTRIDLPVSAPIEQECGAWRLVTDKALLELVASYRQERLPNETGGVLLGNIDAERRIVYAVVALPSPSDSGEWPTSYIRGTQGLAEQVGNIRRTTAEQLDYIGEWHSHPDGAGVSMSDDDQKALRYLSELRAADGRPGVFLIVGEGRYGWHLQGVDQGE